MQKQISSKKIMIILGMAAVILVAAVVMLFSKKEEYFRSVLIYEMEGSAVIERADIGTIDAAENLYLESGDRVSIKEESMMRMKLDDDKYITAEANTVFSLEAKGDERDSKTRISLEQGAVTNEIQNPLSKESIYETATPNSVMAVRGTVYRVQLYDDGEGGENMRLCCFQGTVAATPVLPDGSFGEEVLVHEGSELTVYSDGAVYGPENIDFDSLPEQAIRTLSDLADHGTVVSGITKEELSAILSAQESGDAGVDASEDESAGIAEDRQEISRTDTATADLDQKKTEENSLQSDRKKDTDKPADSKNRTDKKEGNGAGDKTEQSKPEQKTTDTSPATESTSDTSGGSDSNHGNSNQGSHGDSGNKPDNPPKKVTYTVTYKYQGAVFAAQTVEKGSKAAAPVLVPATEGAWDFDFDTEITADTTIEWK